MPEHNDINSAAPTPPSTPDPAQPPSDSSAMPMSTVVSPDAAPNSTVSQPASNDLGSPVVSQPSAGTQNAAGVYGWPGYTKIAVVANIVPIATATGFALFSFYWAFLASAAGSENDASGLISFIAFIVLMVALVALSVFVVPLVIAILTRKKVAGYISGGIGIVGTCLAVVLLISTFVG